MLIIRTVMKMSAATRYTDYSLVVLR